MQYPLLCQKLIFALSGFRLQSKGEKKLRFLKKNKLSTESLSSLQIDINKEYTLPCVN